MSRGLIVGILILVALVQASGFAEPRGAQSLLRFAEWQLTSPANRLLYFNLILKALGEIENRNDLPHCVVGGQVFTPGQSVYVDQNCRYKETQCGENESPCAQWISSDPLCVLKNSRKSATQACWEQLDSQKQADTILLLVDKSQHELWSRMSRAVGELCNRQKTDSCRKLIALSVSIRARIPDESQFIERYEKKLREPREKWGRWSLPPWWRAILPQADAEEICSYDEKSGTFTDAKKQSVQLIFGIHGQPQEVIKIFDKDAQEPGPSALDYRALLKRHEGSFKEMRKNIELSAKALSSKNSLWFGVEGSHAVLSRWGGLKGQMERVKDREGALQKLGFSSDEIRDVLMIIYNPSVYALYRQYMAKGLRPRYVGLDNLRDPDEVDEARQSERLASIEKISSTLDIWISQHWPTWVLEKTKNIVHLSFKETEQAIKILHEVQSDVRFSDWPASQQKALQTVISDLDAIREARAKITKEQDLEFERRNAGMARDILKALSSHGDGFYHVGALHKPGLLADLKTDCLNFAKVHKQNREASGPRTKSRN